MKEVERHEYGRWQGDFLTLEFCRHGPRGDNENLEIIITSDRFDDQRLAVAGTLEIAELGALMRALGNVLDQRSY